MDYFFGGGFSRAFASQKDFGTRMTGIGRIFTDLVPAHAPVRVSRTGSHAPAALSADRHVCRAALSFPQHWLFNIVKYFPFDCWLFTKIQKAIPVPG
jgi:hypothetical protein